MIKEYKIFSPLRISMIKQKNVNQLFNSKIVPIKHKIKIQITFLIIKNIKAFKKYLNIYYKNIIRINYNMLKTNL